LGILKLSESMRLSCSFLAVGGMLVMSGMAFAQPLDNNSEVRVNPLPPGTGRTLLYPGGEYGRSVPQLLYPGERGGPISLHMPSPHAPRHTMAKAQSAAPAAPPAPKPKRVASLPKPAPAPKSAPAPTPPQAAPGKPGQLPGIFGAPDYSNVFGNGGNAPQRQASNAPPPPRTAPAGPTTGNESLTKKSMILFAKDAADPAAGALGSIKFLAGELNSAMTTPNARVELQAFGGTKGDKGSDARRLSLKRALAIRQVLIDDGVSPDRIDVRAMGGVDDTGPTDRVDVYTKA
jgi:outer membrane protein OmpA-like peptidoglycan-associated protein